MTNKILQYPILFAINDITEYITKLPKYVKRVHELHFYTPCVRVHICSLTASAEMYFLTHFVTNTDDLDNATEEELEAIDEFVREINFHQEIVDYTTMPKGGYYAPSLQIHDMFDEDEDYLDLVDDNFNYYDKSTHDYSFFNVANLTTEKKWEVMHKVQDELLEALNWVFDIEIKDDSLVVNGEEFDFLSHKVAIELFDEWKEYHEDKMVGETNDK